MDSILPSHEEKKGLVARADPVQTFPLLDELEENLLGGYKFKNKDLLEEALTHHSFPGRLFSYDRLEYVGDSVLNLMFTKEHYFTYPDLAPGKLTRLRSANVDTEKLARVAIRHGWHQYLRHNIPLLHDQIEAFSEAVLEYPLHSNGLIEVPKVLADIVESLVGAVFVDSNSSIDVVSEVFKKFLEPIISKETLRRHPKTVLYEVCQKENLDLKFLDSWEENMTFSVLVNGVPIGTCTYANKKEIANNRAAQDALNNLRNFLSQRSPVQQHHHSQ